MNLNKILLATWMGILYGGGITLITDLYLHFYKGYRLLTVFFLPRYWIASLLATYHSYFFLQMPHLRWKLGQETEIGSASLVYLGCIYSSLIVYPTELSLVIYTKNVETMLFRMHSSIPFMIMLLCIYDLLSIQKGVRILYFLDRE